LNYSRKLSTTLIDNGYHLVPIPTGYKGPKGQEGKNWTTREYNKSFFRNCQSPGLGIKTGHIVAVDIDVRNLEVNKQIQDYCDTLYPGALKRIGNAPKIILMYRTEEPFQKLKSNTYLDPDGNKHEVEILAQGQQFVAFAQHPDTNQPYQWLDKTSPLDITAKDLPVITKGDVLDIINFFDSVIPTNWTLEKKHKENTDTFSIDPLDIKKPLKVSLEDIKKDLTHIDPDQHYDDWIAVGMSLHHQFKGAEDGFLLWDEWSSRGKDYDMNEEGEMLMKWKSFRSNHQKTYATIKWMAKQVLDQKKTPKPEVGSALLHISDVISKLGPIDWLVKNYVENNTTGLFFGDPCSYKSFLAMDLALHVASGKTWNGNKVKQGSVIYIAGEGHGGFARRMKAWEIENNMDVRDLPMYFTNKPVDFMDQEKAEEITLDIKETIKRSGVPNLIVIDTLARNFYGDENSTGEMGLFISHINDHLRIPFECVVLIIHHSGHKEKGRARGSTALRGGVDFEYQVEKAKEDNMLVKLDCTKLKDAEYPGETWLKGKVVDLDPGSEFKPQEDPGEDSGESDQDESQTSLVFTKCEKPDKVEGVQKPDGYVGTVHELIGHLTAETGKVSYGQMLDTVKTIEGDGFILKNFNRALNHLKKNGRISYQKKEQNRWNLEDIITFQV